MSVDKKVIFYSKVENVVITSDSKSLNRAEKRFFKILEYYEKIKEKKQIKTDNVNG